MEGVILTAKVGLRLKLVWANLFVDTDVATEAQSRAQTDNTVLSTPLGVAQQTIGVAVITSASNLTATDCEDGAVFTLELGENSTLSNPTNKKLGKEYTWHVTQDGTGSRTLAFGTDFDFEGDSTIEATAGSITEIVGKVITETSIQCHIVNNREGTTQITISGSTSGSGTVTGTYSYFKIGRLCNISIIISNQTFPTYAGTLQINLPFACSASSICSGPPIYYFPHSAWNNGAAWAGWTGSIASSANVLTLNEITVNGNRQVSATNVNTATSGASGLYFRCSLTYQTA